MLILKLGIVIVLLAVFIQDLKERLVSVWLFPVLALLLVVLNFWQNRQGGYPWTDAACNLGFLALQLGLVTLFFSIRRRKWTNITTDLLGWGDIFFLIAIAFYLSIGYYLLFYLFSLFLVLAGGVLYQLLVKNGRRPLPLAGLQAFLFMILFIAAWLAPAVDLTRNDHLIRYWPW